MCGVSGVQCAAASGQHLSTISHHGVDRLRFQSGEADVFLCRPASAVTHHRARRE